MTTKKSGLNVANKVTRKIYVDVPGIVKASQKVAVLAVASAGAGEAAKLAPKKDEILMASIQADSISQTKAKYGSNVVYAAIQEFGGTIKPVNAKRLVFDVGGKTVFAKSVTIKPKKYLRGSADWLKKNGSKAYATVLKGALKRG